MLYGKVNLSPAFPLLYLSDQQRTTSNSAVFQLSMKCWQAHSL